MDSSFFSSSCAAAITFFALLGTIIFMFYTKSKFHQENKKIAVASSSSPPASFPSLSLSSPPSSLSQNWKHHVFPSFHGEDVRKSFLSHILKEFRSKGIDPFIDNNIERSKLIGPELIEAIRGSRIATVLLSKNYASSTWCMNELVEIMKCRDKLGQTVMAIFYEVDPTDVKKQAGDFGKVFRKTCKGKTKEDIGRWRHSLAEVATIAGYHSNNWDDEAAMIEKIATDISNKLNSSTIACGFERFIGMGAHIKMMEPLLRLDLDEVRMIGIWGLPGIGKSTIARFLFNQLSNSFQLKAIMVNIKGSYPRPCLDEGSAQLQLQNQMLSQMLNHKDMVITHLGVAQGRLKDKKVFLVLDDVDRLAQLDALAKETQWFGPGSRIIITTEDVRVLKKHGINHIYKVEFPSTHEALQIFCTYAFGQKYPKHGFEELAWEVANLAGELPVGLKVLGSYFRGMSKQDWKNELPRLRKKLEGDIESILKFSYDALSNEGKELFLHIACFFNGEQVKKVVEHLAESFMDVRQELHILADKSLISIENDGWIMMHKLLVQLGKEIIRKQSVGQRQLMVDARDICEALTDRAGSKSVLSITFRYTRDELNITERGFDGLPNIEFLSIKGVSDPPNILSLPERLNYYLAPKLRSLEWQYFPMTCLSFIVNPEFLIELKLENSKLEKLWDGIKPLPNLKWVNLSGSKNLKELPNLSTATNLQELDLSCCSNLVKIPFSIGNATNLQKLNLQYCTSLVELRLSIGNTTHLKELDLTFCSSLVELPSFIGNATNLQKLSLCNCLCLEELPSSIGNASNLQKLDVSGCSSLWELPSSIGNATNLQELNLKYCSSLEELSSSIGNARNLQELDLSGCKSLLTLPSSIGNATNLRKLDLSDCSSLVKLPFSIGNAINLQKLDLRYCSRLVELPSSIGTLDKLLELNLQGCSKLQVLPTNINLKSLIKLNLADCSLLKRFPEISTNISELVLIGTAVEELPLSIKTWSRLGRLIMSYSENLKEFPNGLHTITELHLSDTGIEELGPWVKGVSHLRRLVLEGCRKLVSLPQLPNSLSELDAENCESLERLDCCLRNPDIWLNFANCFKLNQEARDLIIHIGGVAILPGGEVPAYFSDRAYGSSITVKLNQKTLRTTIKFKACILLDNKRKCKVHGRESLSVSCSITAKHNALTACRSSAHDIYPALTGHLYTFEVEAEEVTSAKLVFEFEPKPDTITNFWKIKECGILQLFDIDEHYESFSGGNDDYESSDEVYESSDDEDY